MCTGSAGKTTSRFGECFRLAVSRLDWRKILDSFGGVYKTNLYAFEPFGECSRCSRQLAYGCDRAFSELKRLSRLQKMRYDPGGVMAGAYCLDGGAGAGYDFAAREYTAFGCGH